MANWKTTLFGALAALATYLATVSEPAWIAIVAKVIAAISTVGLGYFAADAKKTAVPTETK